MTFDAIIYDVSDGIATITLNRPEKLNAWTPVMESEVRDALAMATEDAAVRVILLTGAGRGFCAGADMQAVQAGRSARPAARVQPGGPPPLPDFAERYTYILNIPKPVIAAINGAVAGVGLCVALYCDLRYMAQDAKLTTAFARRGLIAEHGSAWMLPRLIGPMAAADLLLTGRTIDAAEAGSLGLVRPLPAAGFGAAVRAIATEMATRCSPRSMRIIKRQLQLSPFQGLGEAVRMADEEQALSRSSADRAEGIAHFLEKRPPNFTGC